MKIADIKVDYLGGYGDDLTVVNAARVSFKKRVERTCTMADIAISAPCLVIEEREVKLINYLAKHKHFSPFNHAFLSFRVKMPIFVARQLVKHKFLPWNEVSRRYVDDEPEFYVPSLWRAKSDNVKQGSSNDSVNNLHIKDHGWVTDPETLTRTTALRCYEALLEQGVAPEQARMVLPQNTMTEVIWSGTLGAFLDMLVLRLDPHTQRESRDVAELIATHVKRLFPVSYNARVGQ